MARGWCAQALWSCTPKPPRRTPMSKFKFRNARLLTAIVALVAIVVDSGAAHKF